MVKRRFTLAMLKAYSDALRINKPIKNSKFSGVTKEQDAYYYTDKKGVKRRIIPGEEQEKFIQEQYMSKEHGLSSAQKFYKYLSSNYTGISRERMLDVLQGIPIYQQFKPALNVHATTKPIISRRPYGRLQIDLIDMSKLAKYNSGYRYALTIIDLFSKYAWVIPIKTRDAGSVWNALRGVLDALPETPGIVQSDNGGEFKSEVSDGLAQRKIKQIFSSAYHPQSQGAIEHFNGTFKRYLARYLAADESKRWIDQVDNIVNNYNTNIHGTTKDVPEQLIKADEVKDQEQRADAVKNIEKAAKRSLSYTTSFKDDLRVGDYVRTALETSKDLLKNKLSKRNLNPTYSKEIYQIKQVIKPRESKETSITPIKYRLVGLPGFYYRIRLLKTKPPNEEVGNGVDEDEELARDEEVKELEEQKVEEQKVEEQKVEEKAEVEEKKVEQQAPKRKKKRSEVVPPVRRSSRVRKPVTKLDL